MRSLVLLSALACGLAGLLPSACRAEFITPDSISRPSPGNVGSANGTPIASAADLVTGQYAALGLVFPPHPGPSILPTAVAVTAIDGVNVWVPALTRLGVPNEVAVLNYFGAIHGQLTAPTGTLAVEVMGLSGPLLAFDSSGNQIGFDFSNTSHGPHGGRLLQITAAGIESFTVLGPLVYDFLPDTPPPPWGIAGVSTTAGAPITAPEPSALLLAALGAAGSLCGMARSRLRRQRA